MSRIPHFALLLCFIGLPSASAQPAPGEELKSLRQRISELQQDLEQSSESRSSAADALRESERAISGSKRKIAELAAQQIEARARLGQLQQQKNQISAAVKNQQAWLGQMLYQHYLNGKQEHLGMLLNNRDPNRIARDIHYFGYIARDRAARISGLQDDLRQLEDITAKTQQQGEEIAALQAEEKSQQRTLERERQARRKVLDRYAQQIRQQRREIGRLQRDARRLSRLVERLAEMLSQQGDRPLFSNDQLPDNRFDRIPFERLRGKLTLPVKGVVINRFGQPRPDSTVRWDGLMLRAAAGQAVKAVAAGRVVYADWLRGFGNLMVIDHGKGYMSLYGNNEALYKQVGDILTGGDTVASVGNSGGNTDHGLYFELRHKGKPLDPMKWVAR